MTAPGLPLCERVVPRVEVDMLEALHGLARHEERAHGLGQGFADPVQRARGECLRHHLADDTRVLHRESGADALLGCDARVELREIQLLGVVHTAQRLRKLGRELLCQRPSVRPAHQLSDGLQHRTYGPPCLLRTGQPAALGNEGQEFSMRHQTLHTRAPPSNLVHVRLHLRRGETLAARLVEGSAPIGRWGAREAPGQCVELWPPWCRGA